MLQKQYETGHSNCLLRQGMIFISVFVAFFLRFYSFIRGLFSLYSLLHPDKSGQVRGISSLKSHCKNRFLSGFRMSGNSCVVQAQDLF